MAGRIKRGGGEPEDEEIDARYKEKVSSLRSH
jgi:hypothetical protein